MKKILLLTLAVLMTSIHANACEGVSFQGASGKSYCLSKHTMNWYSGYAWCHDQGMQLVDITKLCNTVELSSCPEFKLTQEEKDAIVAAGGKLTANGWTNVSFSDCCPVTINLGNAGNIGFSNTQRYHSALALCE